MPLLCFINSSPEFSLLVEPPSGNAEHLIAEIPLPGVVSNGGLVFDQVQLHVNTKYEIMLCRLLHQISARSLVLDLGEDRLVLVARPSLFHLDIFFPLLIDQENSVAQFNTNTQVSSCQDSILFPFQVFLNCLFLNATQ